MIITTVSLGHLIAWILFLSALLITLIWLSLSLVVRAVMNLFRAEGRKVKLADIFFMRWSKLK